MARPTDYSEEIIKKGWKYLKQFTDGKRPKDEVIPSIEGLALYLDINRSTLYDWDSQKDKQEFSNIMEVLRALQGKTLLTGTLLNKLNANIGKAILSRHGYTEKTETESKITHSVDEETINNINKALDEV